MDKNNMKRLPDQVSLCSTRPAMTNAVGRSMVEMLGVLAIIGVLSAGALAGYSKAMFRHKVNQTIDIFSQVLQRFAELEQKNLGDNFFDIDNADRLMKYGLVDNCQKSDDGQWCKMPIGLLTSTIECSGTNFKSSCMGEFQINLTSSKECVAFASAGWENVMLIDWFNAPHNGGGGLTAIHKGADNKIIYNLHNVNYDIVNAVKMENIVNACALCDEEDGCEYILAVREWL